jgi:hypothetical protein
MIAINLQDTLVTCLQDVFKDYALQTKSGNQKNVKVFSQYLPRPKQATVKPRGKVDEEEPEDQYSAEDFDENCLNCFSF